jgi:methylaspartate mutase sigma subunit
MPDPVRGSRVILSTVSSDSHTWNLVFLQLFLEEIGCTVINLGACVPDDVIIESIRLHAPDAVVISSVNGHGHIDGARLIGELRADQEPAVANVPVVIGGKLGINGAADGQITGRLLAAGFDAVFTDGTDLSQLTRTMARLAPGREPASLAGAGR